MTKYRQLAPSRPGAGPSRPRPPTDKQVKFAEAIAAELAIDPDEDWYHMTAEGLDPATGGFADNY